MRKHSALESDNFLTFWKPMRYQRGAILLAPQLVRANSGFINS